MKVSIVIPVYNVEAYIGECVASVMAQTYPAIECILVDDCSPDNSMAIAEGMIAAYTGPVEFRLLRHERNRGVSAARNIGTQAATGEYLYYLDSDDYITPDCIETLVRVTAKYPGVDVVQGNLIASDREGVRYPDLCKGDPPEYTRGNRQIRENFAIVRYLQWTVWNKLIRLEVARQNNLAFVEGEIYEDILWLFNLAGVIDSIAFCKSRTYFYRSWEGSLVNSSTTKQMLGYTTQIMRTIIDTDREMTLNEKKFYYDYLVIYYKKARDLGAEGREWVRVCNRLLLDYTLAFGVSPFRARLGYAALSLLPGKCSDGREQRILRRMLKYALLGKEQHRAYSREVRPL